MTALVDTNVLVAAAVAVHPFHTEARDLFVRATPTIAAHSMAELYNTLTRPALYAWPPEQAARLTRRLGIRHAMRGLTPDQYLTSIDRFAAVSGVGPRLYDFLIGEVASCHGLEIIVTLNLRDFVPLFPRLSVLTPLEYLETL